MLKKIGLLLIAATIIFFGGYKILQIKRLHTADSLQPTSSQQIIAIFDTSSNLISRVTESALHYTLSWKNDLEQSLPKEMLQSLVEKKEPLFINLQIWHKELIDKLDNEVATNILNGDYDKKLISLFELLAKSTKPVYISFNGEMEVPVNNYPWQYQPCMQYIRSFRRIALTCKKYSPNVKVVWGCAGYPGVEEYWPGNDYVDLAFINMSLSPEIKNDPYPPYSSATEMMRRKIFRMRFINKPVLLMGTSSFDRETLKEEWITKLNNILLLDKTIYRTPTEPLVTDSIDVNKRRDNNLKVGVYDPMLLLVTQPKVTVEHIFTDLESVNNGFFKKNFDSVIARQHDVIVTMEPWKDGKIEKDSAILTHVLNGVYDKTWAKLYQQISNVQQTVYLRWGHEMEIPVNRYAWQNQDPVTYIKAFRYFATFQKIKAANIKIVWGPAGDRGSVEWWPGEEVVDFISIAIYGIPDKNINDYTKQQNFAAILFNKLHRMRFAHKPIFITEFGVKGPEAYQKKWLEEAAIAINKYPQIKGINYFNYADTPKAWGDADTPDWSITVATFNSFTALLNNLPK